MINKVYECFKRIVANRKKPKIEPMIDGYNGFLFLDKKDMMEVVLHWEKHFEWALAKYNRIYKEKPSGMDQQTCLILSKLKIRNITKSKVFSKIKNRGHFTKISIENE